MKRLMIITAVFALLLTGCGTRVSHDTLIELSVSSITEYQNRLNAIHPKDLQVSINELAQKEGLETRVATSEYSGKEYQYSRAYLDDGTEYSISATDPENVGISGFTAHYLRMSDAKKFSPEYHVLQYVRFYLGDPRLQGEYVCVAEFDFT